MAKTTQAPKNTKKPKTNPKTRTEQLVKATQAVTPKPIMGRPVLYSNPEELSALIDEYFDFCDNRVQQVYSPKAEAVIEIINPEPYTMSGLAYHLGMDRRTLLDYGTKDTFLALIKYARARVERDVERRLFEGGGNVAGAIFNLKNNFGWRDQKELEHDLAPDLKFIVGRGNTDGRAKHIRSEQSAPGSEPSS